MNCSLCGEFPLDDPHPVRAPGLGLTCCCGDCAEVIQRRHENWPTAPPICSYVMLPWEERRRINPKAVRGPDDPSE